MNRAGRSKLLILITITASLLYVFFRLQNGDIRQVNGEIAFVSDQDGDFEIYALNPQTGQARNLTNYIGMDYHPGWSPDGEHLLFLSNRDGPDTDVFVMTADGEEITNVSNNTVSDYVPSWSPDGQSIAFSSGEPGEEAVFVASVNGDNLQRITSAGTRSFGPGWSPDGTEMAFLTLDENGRTDIAIVRLEDAHIRSLTSEDRMGSVMWSPTGDVMAVQTNLSSESTLYLLDLVSNDMQPVSNHETYPFRVRWSPDGQYLAYAEASDEGTGDIVLYDIATDTATTLYHVRRLEFCVGFRFDSPGRTVRSGRTGIYIRCRP
jgi:Tol biopolymer transport system component